MAAKRGKSQARRTQGNGGGLPGWAWGIAGLLLGVVLILMVPRYLKSDGDGFFRPHPNPDAQPAPVVSEPDVVDEAARDEAVPARAPVPAPKKSPDFDFYTMLPGKEVPLSDAELAATARAEAQREATAQAASGAAQAPATATEAGPTARSGALPAPLATDADVPSRPATPSATAPAAPATASVPAAPAEGPARPADSTRYLLQAGAFEASGQAEELKARIAMLGLGARVESAQLGGRTVYRVRMGPYGTASELAEAKRKLAGGGLPGIAIKVE